MKCTALIVLLGISLVFLHSPLQPLKGNYTRGALPSFSEIQDYSSKTWNSAVLISSEEGQCTATVISNDYALTAAHCVTERSRWTSGLMDEVKIIGYSQQKKETTTLLATPVAANIRADYALIKGDFTAFSKVALLHSSDMLMLLQGPFIACGFPYNSAGVCYQGENIAKQEERLLIDAAIFPGMSGGPVVNRATGEVFAVITAMQGSYGVITPLIGLFESFGIEVIH
jgi:S1-C subfamily serine protease